MDILLEERLADQRPIVKYPDKQEAICLINRSNHRH